MVEPKWLFERCGCFLSFSFFLQLFFTTYNIISLFSSLTSFYFLLLFTVIASQLYNNSLHWTLITFIVCLLLTLKETRVPDLLLWWDSRMGQWCFQHAGACVCVRWCVLRVRALWASSWPHKTTGSIILHVFASSSGNVLRCVHICMHVGLCSQVQADRKPLVPVLAWLLLICVFYRPCFSVMVPSFWPKLKWNHFPTSSCTTSCVVGCNILFFLITKCSISGWWWLKCITYFSKVTVCDHNTCLKSTWP